MLERIGRYEILERVASGGQGTVYRARDTVLDRTVAVKVINQNVEDDPGYLEALQREARLAARLDHPNITTVYDFQVEGSTAYIVMEFVPDALDRQLQSNERLPWRRAIEIGLQVARALQHAHDQGVVHRDIKPQNILLRETGAAAVSDFGIARALASSTRSQTGGVMGTPAYMSPEQWDGGAVDSRLDQYGLGIVLYEIITGSPPFRGDSWGAMYVQHREASVPEFSSSLQVPVEVENVIRKMLEKSADDRYGSATKLADALEGSLTGRTAHGPSTEVPPPPRIDPPKPEVDPDPESEVVQPNPSGITAPPIPPTPRLSTAAEPAPSDLKLDVKVRGDGDYGAPWSVAVAFDGSVYLTDISDHIIRKFTPEGAFVTGWGTEGTGDGQFFSPHGVALAPDGSVYVADSGNNCIQKFTFEGSFVSRWGCVGSLDSQFRYPYGVAVAPDGSVYVADTYNHGVQKLTSEGVVVSKWGISGPGEGQFRHPSALALAPDGSVYVADSGNNCIQRFTSDGVFINRWGAGGSGDNQFRYPRGVAVAPDGSVYVADTYNHGVQKFTSEGVFVSKWTPSDNEEGQFRYPRGVAVASDGNVYVSNANGIYLMQQFAPGPEITGTLKFA